MKYTIGIDLGGTKIACGLVDPYGYIVERSGVPTGLPRPQADLENTIAKLCEDVCNAQGIKLCDVLYIGIGCPGTVNADRGIIDNAANFGYRSWALADNIKSLTGVTTYVGNDANCAALGECLYGAGKGCESMVMLTIGTGIGGGIVIDGRIHTGFSCKGAELGHMVVVKGGRQCTCGRKGCIEQYASSGALTRDALKAIKHNPHSLLASLYSENNNEMNAKIIFEAYTCLDSCAQKLMNDFFEYLACGISSLVNILEPEVVCIGGGISREGDALTEPLRKLLTLDEYRPLNDNATRIVTAKLFNDAGIIGAARLGKGTD